jgi:chemotaxis protein MotA
MEKRALNLMIASAIGIVFHIFVYIATASIGAGSMKRALNIMGGDFPGGLIHGIIQAITTIVFIWAVLEWRSLRTGISHEESALRMGLLPEKEQLVLSPDDVGEIKLKMIEIENKVKYVLTDLIKQACTKFRSNKSSSEMLEVVTTQSRLNHQNSESAASLIRFASSAIPAIGFIGTIMGIATAIGDADKVIVDPALIKAVANVQDYAADSIAKAQQAKQGIQAVTKQLFVAFDTTIWALILNLIITYLLNKYEEMSDNLHSSIESYVVNNLVNRVYNK